MTRTAVIIGAGSAGLCCALSLLKAGWDVTILECQSSAERYAKGWVTIFCNGQRALRWLDVDIDTLAQREGIVITHLGIGSLRILAGLSERELAYGLRLADYIALLTQLVQERGATVLWGQRVVNIDRAEEKAVVTLEDGSTRQADLLIGADGLKSMVRDVLNPGQNCLRKLDQLNVRGWSTAKLSKPLPPPDVLYFQEGRRLAFGYVPARDGSVWFIANWQPDGEAKNDLRADLVALCSEDPEVAIAKELFASSQTTLTGPWQFEDVPHVPKWHNSSNIVLVGSAAHGVASNTGTGVSLGVEDAVVLGRCISSFHSMSEALIEFEKKRKSRCEGIVNWGARFAIYKPGGPLRAWLKSWFLPLAFRLVSLFSSPGATSVVFVLTDPARTEDPQHLQIQGGRGLTFRIGVTHTRLSDVSSLLWQLRQALAHDVWTDRRPRSAAERMENKANKSHSLDCADELRISPASPIRVHMASAEEFQILIAYCQQGHPLAHVVHADDDSRLYWLCNRV